MMLAPCSPITITPTLGAAAHGRDVATDRY
jgi:hypothetical protein